MKKNITKKRTVSLICMLTIILNSFMMFGYTSASAISWQDKIEDELWALMEETDEPIDIIIFRESIDNTTKEAAVLKKTGYNVQIYENEELFEKHVMPAITEKVVAKYGAEAYSTAAFEAERGEKISQIDIAVREEYDKYIMAKRATIAELNTKSNTDFIDKTLLDETKISYIGTYTSSIIATLNENEIISIAQEESVKQIRIFENAVMYPAMNYSKSQVKADVVSGSSYNNGSGYKGTGIKIGIIEAACAAYDPSNPHLSSIHSSGQLQLVNTVGATTSTVSDHATLVTAIIAGQAYTYNGNTYEGIVPNATVYQTYILYTDDFIDALTELISLGVTVVNYSGGNYLGGNTYTSFDQEVDELINASGITLVAAAGNITSEPNTINVYSPAKAFNTIAVGSALTINDTRYALSAPFNVSDTSSYQTAYYLPNKPDVCAPGKNIAIFNNDELLISSGTSLAAPIVTGIVAQIMQAKPTAQLKPTEIKAILFRGTNNAAISSTNNISVWEDGLMRQKTGLGLVDAKATIDYLTDTRPSAALTANFDISSYTGNWETSPKTYTAGQKLRAVLVFNKPEDISIDSNGYGNDVDLSFVNSSGDTVAYSISTYNNVEVIEYTITTSGSYYFIVSLEETIDTSSKTILSVSLAYGIED